MITKITDASILYSPFYARQRTLFRRSDGVLVKVFAKSGSGIQVTHSNDGGLTWQTPSTISTSTTQSLNAWLDSSNNLYVVYIGLSGSQYVLKIKKCTLSGDTWTIGSENIIFTPAANHGVNTAYAVIKQQTGRIWVVYGDTDDSAGTMTLEAGYSDDDGSSWSTTSSLATSLDDTLGALPVLVLRNGLPMAIWHERTSTGTLSIKAREWNGSTWDAATSPTYGTGYIISAVSLNDNTVHLVQGGGNDVGLSSGIGAIKHSIYNGSWSANETIGTSSKDGSLTTDGENVFLVYRYYNGDKIFYRKWVATSQAWANTTKTILNNGRNNSYPNTPPKIENNLLLTWTEAITSDYPLYFASIVVNVDTTERRQIKKRFLYKISDNTGAIKEIPASVITNRPQFKWEINGGMGELVIDLGLTLEDFQTNYENDVIKFGNTVKCYVFGVDEIDGTKIFEGTIMSYEPEIANDGKEKIKVHIISHFKELEDTLLKSGSDTEVAYSSQDPADILKDVLDKYGGTLTYSYSSIENAGTTVTYTFSYATYLEVINKILELCPSFWYYAIDAENNIYLKPTEFDSVDHELYLGREVASIEATKTIEDLYNAVFFLGGDLGAGIPLYKKYERTSSISEYGRREKKIQDERVVVADTAETIATKFLDEHDHPLSIVTATVLDNSVDPDKGYNIESFRVGQMVQIRHPLLEVKETLYDEAYYDVDFYDYNIIYSIGIPLQIKKIDYNFDHVILHLSSTLEDVVKRIEDIQRNLDVLRSADIPSAPS